MLSVQLPLRLEDGVAPIAPPSKYPVSFASVFSGVSDEAVAGLAATLKAGRTVEIDMQSSIAEVDQTWDALEDLLTRATTDTAGSGTIVLCTSQLLQQMSNG